MTDAAGTTSIRSEIGNALGELNRSRPRLAAYVDANRAGPTRASYANASARLLYAFDLFIVKYGIPPHEVGRLRISSTRKPYGVTFQMEEGIVKRRPTARGAEKALTLNSSQLRVGSEMGGDEMAWMLRRPKRVQEWAVNDNIADAIEDLFHTMDRWCDVNDCDPRFLDVQGFYARGLTYVDLTFTDNTPPRYR